MIIEKAREFQKNVYFCFIDYPKVFDCVENTSRGGDTRPLTCLLQNLYAGQEATVRIGHGTTDWFQIGKAVCQSCILDVSLSKLREMVKDREAWHVAVHGVSKS